MITDTSASAKAPGIVPRRRAFSVAGPMCAALAAGVLLHAGLTLVGRRLVGLEDWLAALLALIVIIPLTAWAGVRIARPITATLHALSDGINSFRDHDFGVRIPSERGDELGDLVRLYNRVGDLLQEERSQIRQRELLLQAAFDQSPIATVLVNSLERVVYANQEARRLFLGNERMGGRHFGEILAGCPEELRQVLASGNDGIFTLPSGEQTETYHLARRRFSLNQQYHSLYLLRRMTPELARQEVEIWKKVIRIISHELNNSLAPISSLAHSGKLISGQKQQLHRLDSVFDSIRERVDHLTRFLEGYAKFARLPEPKKQSVEWRAWLEGLRGLYHFELQGELPATPGHFDPAQIQQVLINLLKNAVEAGEGADREAQVVLRIERLPDRNVRVQVMDRGRGMSEDVMRQALLPFYSTKPHGAGLGLPLCREIIEAHGGALRLEVRRGGGTTASFTLPRKP